jgi:branched-chain amino acid transport system permease protein
MKWPAILTGIVIAVAALALPWFTTTFTESLATTCCILATLTISWNLMGGFGGLFSFGHAAFFGIGAYATAMLEQHTSLPFVVTVTGGGLAAAVVGSVLIPCFRTRGIYFAILTLALAEGLRLSAERFFPGGASGLFLDPVFGIDSHGAYLFTLATVAFALTVTVLIRRSTLGRGLAAIRSDEVAAEAVGVNTLAVKAVTSIVSAGLAGLAGGSYAITQAFVDPGSVFDVQYSIVPVLMATLGGMGTLLGPILGAVLWSVLDEVIRGFSDAGALSTIVYGALLILLATWLPAGVGGLLRRLAERVRQLRPARVATAAPTGRKAT